MKIQKMKQIAIDRGGKCISDIYLNAKTKLLWECGEGHRWKAIPGNVERGRWCPHCAGVARLTIEEMQRIAEKRGGRCLSESYFNAQVKLKWECKEGHQWETAPDNIKNGTWCPKCSGKKKYTIKNMQEIALKYGGKCLSNSYKNTTTKLLWECKDGYKWEAIPGSIINGTWCPKCA